MKRIFVLALAILVCAAGFGQDNGVDMSKYLAQDAVVMKDGKEFYGVNVENASYGATNCGERSAVFVQFLLLLLRLSHIKQM